MYEKYAQPNKEKGLGVIFSSRKSILRTDLVRRALNYNGCKPGHEVMNFVSVKEQKEYINKLEELISPDLSDIYDKLSQRSYQSEISVLPYEKK